MTVEEEPFTLAVSVSRVAIAWRALERQRDRWIGHALAAGLKAASLRRQLTIELEEIRPLLAALKDIQAGVPNPQETAMRALRAYALRNVTIAAAS